MSKITIVEGNSNDKDNVRCIMVKGEKGYSAYEIAVQNGYEGTEEEWKNSFLNADNYYNKSEVKGLVINNLESKLTDQPLSAKQGNVLNDKIEEKEGKIKVNYLSSKNNFVDIATSRFLGNCVVIDGDKKGIIDFGFDSTGQYLLDFLSDNNINKIDFIVISHYHADHINGLNAFLQSGIDISECIAYLPHKNIDWQSFNGTEVTGLVQAETSVKNLLNSVNMTIIEPNNLDVVELDNNTSLNFFNIGSDLYDEYYDVLTAWTLAETENTNYNNFSMIVELKHFNNKFLFTSDIEEKAQSLNYQYLKDIDVLHVEHHSLNRDSNKNYLAQLNPKHTVISDIDNLEPHQLINNTTYNSYTKGSKIYHTRYNDVTIISTYAKIYSESPLMNVFNVNNNLFGGLPIYENEDLNNYVIEGSYYALTSFVSQTLSNCPYINSGFKMVVEKLTGANATLRQSLIPANNINNIIYSRVYADGQWRNWEALQFGLLGTLQSDNLTISDKVTVTAISTSISFINNIIIGNFEFTTTEAIPHGTDIFVIPGNIKMGNADCSPTYRSETTNFSLVDGNANEYSGYVGTVTSDNTLHVRARKDIPANTVMHGSFVKAPKLRDLTLYTSD